MNQETIRDPGPQDLAGLFSRLKRHLPLSVAIVAAMLVLAYVGTKLMSPKYTATTQLQYAPAATLARDAGSQAQRSLSDQERDAAISAQLQIVSSLPVAKQVLRDKAVLNNARLRQVAKSMDPSGQSVDALASALLANVAAARVGQTPLFTISYTDANPLDAARIANAFSRAYLTVQAQQKAGTEDGGKTDLNKQLALLGQRAREADAAVAAYRLRNNIVVDPTSTGQGEALTDMNNSLAGARGEAAQAAVRGQASGSTVISGGVDTSALSSLRQQRAEAARDLAGLSARYGDRNPQVIDARQRVAELDKSVDREMASVSRSVRAESDAARARAASIESSLAQTQGRLASNVRAGVELAELQRRADAARQLYSNLLANVGQQTTNLAIVQPDAQIVVEAVPPLSPSSPRLLINLLVGFALGSAIALALAYLRERWSQTINTIDDIQRLLGVDFLNSIPTLTSAIDKPRTKDAAEAVILHPMSSYAEAFRSLATTLIFDAREAPTEGGRVIGVTSALPREGKTTTTASMARVLAMASTKVVIIDADLRRRSVTQAMCPDATLGWTNALNGETTLRDVMVADQTGAVILPITPGAEKSQRIFETEAFKDMLATLRREFEVILIDTAPVLAVVDTRTMIPQLDSLALLTHWRRTPVKAVRAALHQIETVGGSVAGVAMTMVNLKTQAQSGYGDASYYYTDMKEYYVSN
ncbi:AAA family ATPase [Sphingomonas sp. BK580]|uniref:GumC family protein n=1 Tax=Sphingomonas sp. BK580 TaxID=2586972 RepID=UPI00161F8789|nr:AAA family ATPase [Sphingomonas sp. BK580]MBB3695756.1 capsular exopolysaccharide synthesis family protein [Sphingomonas sp. BK580]